MRVMIVIPVLKNKADGYKDRYNTIRDKIIERGDKPVAYINLYNCMDPLSDKEQLYRLYYSIEVMKDCDCVYFGKGWNTDIRCIDDYTVASKYGLKIEYEGV
nr:MAG TPA: Blasticidin M [Caudoviricetes sp.]